MKMPRTLILIGTLTVLACGLGVAQQEDDLILGFRGKSTYQIVIPDPMANTTVSNSVNMAAGLLQTAFATNGIVLEIKRESEIDGIQPGIYLGPTQFAQTNGVDIGKLAGLSGYGYIHKAVGPNIIIAGDDQPDLHVGQRVHTPKDKAFPLLATLFGTTEFLYRYAGVRFLSPAPRDTSIAYVPVSIIHVPHDLNTKAEPYLIDQNSAWYWPTLYATAMHGSRYHRVWSGGGHQHCWAIPVKEYGESHPEYFILTAGQRAPKSEQLCFSNPEVRELIYKHILAKCDEGFDIIELNQNDGFQPCQCEKCAELYGFKPTTTPTDGSAYYNDPAWGEKIWTMHRNMALRLLEDRPGKTLMLFSYGPTRNPPQTISEFPANTMVEMSRYAPEDFANWAETKVPCGFAAYLYNWGTYQLWLPLNTVPWIADQNSTLVTNKVRVVFLDSPPQINLGLEGPNLYVFLRLGIEPYGKSADELFNEYLQAAFRETENPMRHFFTTLQRRVALMKVMGTWHWQSGGDALFTIGTLYTPDLIDSLEEDLAMAEQAAVLPGVKARLEIIRYEFDYLKHAALVVGAYRNYQAVKDAYSLNQVLDTVDDRNQFIAQIVNGDEKYGRGENPAWGNKGELDLKYSGQQRMFLNRSPFNWDTAKIRANPGSLLQREKKTEATLTDHKPSLDDPVWEKLEPQTLVPVDVSVTNLNAETTFKLLYDKDNLYVRVSGEQPADKMVFVNRGRDAELWLQESIVVNVSPFGDRSRYYYFAYEPEPNSFNDAQHGFITDTLHPRYGWNDENWNGLWSFETRLLADTQRWESMAVIPFKTMLVAPPKPGDVWFINVGRVHFMKEIVDKASRKNSREMSAWTGTLNPSRVAGDASFGKMMFK